MLNNMTMYPFINTNPIESKSGMLELQSFLLKEAEKRLGPRNTDKSILPPQFNNRGPYIFNTKNQRGARAVLSYKAFNNWPRALYELAHETIHLLDPIIGPTNYLEEGIAVKFSNDMVLLNTNCEPPTLYGNYQEALTLIHKLPDPPYVAAHTIRKHCQSLSNTQIADLAHLFPSLEQTIIDKLCSQLSEK